MAGQSSLDKLWGNLEYPKAPRLDNVLTHISHFLQHLGYTKTSSALSKEAAKNGIELEGLPEGQTEDQLMRLYDQWYWSHQKHLSVSPEDDIEAGAPENSSDSSSESSSDSDEESERDEIEGVLVDVEAEETSDDDSDEKSEDEDEDSDSSSSESSSSVSTASPVKHVQKRKRSATPEEQDESDDDSSSDDSDSDERPAKKTKVEADETEDSDVDKESDSSSDSDSSSSSSSDSESSSDEDDASDDDESSSSDSSSDDDEKVEKDERSPPPSTNPSNKKKGKKQRSLEAVEIPRSTDGNNEAKDGGSLSSATLEAESPAENDTPGQIHPDRLKQLPADKRTPSSKKEVAELKKQQHVPFSRIPVDQAVDPRFASNAYVSYDYADRAHRDLIVTKGKGFTKEKNKKKRGSYRGGAIDLTPKGIKFDD